ncbi:hypothetical protein A2773_01175 [Candidatus Gottesmanbacteria bacterium RIFCSPHIGHO2_01_FULL_39_10]|uniref:Uncharacterized protein n=1 Tax=Candidatus Gottesmanbacteria bacterium RIFCSPHIGHO2_01_FULL_39_10 TaxID=1798375 RepID=A0A1F5ZL66_9BACT|nr:MAG: hypothetical protein A2773_01175 [Candidatus Gottesmanbacteria bacterium RIFCSPHIGHO2_01_FULL_39_10]
MKHKLVLSFLGLTILGVAALGTFDKQVWAKTTNSPMTSLITEISQKFGLNQADVQSVFDEHRNQMHERMQVELLERLSELVNEGKITETQKQLLLDKHKEMVVQRESDRQNWQTKTAEERKALMQTKHQELVNWAEVNGIDLKYLFHFGPHHGPKDVPEL